MKCIVINKAKIIITNLIIYFLIVIFLLNSKVTISSISNSTNIFLNKLVPALLPYILLTELVMRLNITENLTYGFTNILCKLFHIPESCSPTVVISYLLGYPNAAKHISKLYEEQKINLNTAKKLSKFTNNASPAYIVGTIGIAMLNNVTIGIILLVSHFLASFIIGISSFNYIPIIQQNNTISNSFKQISFSFEILLKSLFGSIKTLGVIWGFTVIFSLIPNILLNNLNLPEYISGLLVGIFEISNGINILSNINIDFTIKLCLISFVLSFSSLMVILQVFSFVYTTGVKLSYIVSYKLLQGLLSSCITFILTKVFFNNKTLQAFSSFDNLFKTKPIPCYIYLLIAFVSGFLLFLIIQKKR